VILELALERLGLLELAEIPLPILIVATLVGGFPRFREAVEGIRSKRITADLLMTVGIVAALSIREFSAALLIVFFMSIAHFVEGYTVRKSHQAIDELIKLVPKTARVRKGDKEVEISVDELKVGDLVLVRPGERIPADGAILRGRSSVDQSPITGESIPTEKNAGDIVFAGTINQLGMLEVDVTRVGQDATLGRIIAMVEEAEASKAPIQKFADRYSSYYLPILLIASLVTFVVTGIPTYAIAVLVVACPCAVALATPLAVVASVGSSAKKGILIKGGLFLERLAKVDTVIVDKTGTLTLGRPRVTDTVTLAEINETELIRLAASAERYSEHPLASALLDEAESRNLQLEAAEGFEAHPGMGVTCKIRGSNVTVGNMELLDSEGVDFRQNDAIQRLRRFEKEGKTVLLVALDTKLMGIVAVADVIRSGVSDSLRELKRMGIKEVILLTGDNERVAVATAESLGISRFKANVMPEDKVREVLSLQRQGRTVAMIGDGVNDAPALAQADVGIAMGAGGSDVALEAAPLVLMRDDWAQIPVVVKTARQTLRTIKQNVVFGILFNMVGVVLASVGILPPILAAAAQSLPDVAVFLNSSRLLRS
jgi:Cd2+/Zn2+-exporting ATPase/Cu+-exporting ATPase